MELGKVVGKLWLSSAHSSIRGFKLLIVKPYDPKGKKLLDGYQVVADTVDAGVGDVVFYCGGSAVRQTPYTQNVSTDRMISGVVDEIATVWDNKPEGNKR